MTDKDVVETDDGREKPVFGGMVAFKGDFAEEREPEESRE